MLHDDRLRRALGFDEDDLRSNRQGSLTEIQWALVRSRYRQYVRNGLIVMGVMWLFFVVLMVGSLIAEGMPAQDAAVLPYVLLGLTVFFGVVAVGGLIYGRNLAAGRVSIAQGRAAKRYSLVNGRGRRYPRWQVRLGRRTFMLPSSLEFDAFDEGVFYRLYYVRYAPLHVLLSAEMVDGGEGE